MNTATPAPTPVPSRTRWTGIVLGALPVLLLLFSAAMKLAHPAGLDDGFTHIGVPIGYAFGLGILEIACALLYAIPRTSVLGAVLLTGYMGGAILTHLRVGDPYWVQALIGVAVWGGLYLREPRLRALLPLRR